MALSSFLYLIIHLLDFRISKSVIRVPMLVPGLEYTFETLVECVSDMGIADQVCLRLVGIDCPST